MGYLKRHTRLKMKILVSNDDGHQAQGILCLVETLEKFADITVVAPDRNRSGASNSLTLEYPIRAQTAANGFIYVDGTPTDCVHLALTGLLDNLPDIVVSGINAGANLGDDVIYSGTVAAAMEGRNLGFPALAVSMASHHPKHYDTGAKVVADLLKRLKVDKLSLPVNTILNINVPDCPWEQLAGTQITRLGNRHQSEPAVKSQDPRGRPVYWIGPTGSEQDAGPGTDFYAVNQGFVSITPLHIDLTSYAALDAMKTWLND